MQGFFNSWLLYREKLSFGLVPAPNPAHTRAILCNAAAWGSSATKLEVLLTEVNQQYGYTRHTWDLTAADVTYDAVDKRVEIVEETWHQAATTDSIQWNGVVVMVGASATANRVVNSIDAAASTFTLAGHGLTENYEIIMTADPGGTLAGGLPVTPQILYARNVTANTYQVALTNGGAPITLTNAGIGALRVRYAGGEIVAGYRDNVAKLIPPSATREFVWDFKSLNIAPATGLIW